jgi:glycosyltransferase involved in cell wall biosynthesis
MTNSHNILFVHYGDDGIRGSEQILLNIIKNLSHDFRAYLWTNSPSLEKAAKPFVSESRLDNFTLLLNWEKPRFNLVNFLHLISTAKKLIKGYQIDLIHCNSAGPNQWLQSVSTSLKVPVILHLHAHYLMRDLISLRVLGSPLIVTASPSVEAELLDLGLPSSNTQTITNSIDDRKFMSDKPVSVRKLICASKDETVIATTGALIPTKGQHILIEALSILKNKGYPVKLALIGSGYYKQNLENLSKQLGISSDVFFLGQRNDVASLLKGDVDIFVTPTFGETYPLVVQEAAFAALPIIATKVGSITAMLKHNESALLINHNDTQGLVEAIEDLLLHQDKAKSLGEAAYKTASKKFTLTRFTHEFDGLYRNVLSNPEQAISTFKNRLTWLYFTFNYLSRLLIRKLNFRSTIRVEKSI